MLFLPETVLLLSALLLFAASVMGSSAHERNQLSVLLAAGVAACCAMTIGASGQPFFPGIYEVDLFSQLAKLGIAVGLLLTMMLSEELKTVRPGLRADVPFFMFVAAAGMMMLVSATELLTMYVTLELSAYAMFILIASHRSQHRGTEAGIKTILYGAAASAITLYGLSLIFGMTGSTYIADIRGSDVTSRPLFYMGLVLTLSGFLFKLAVFPFHAWAPDAYEGAPDEVVTFVGTVSKLAAAAVLLRVTTFVWTDPGELTTVFFVLATLSMTIGNLAALRQNDLKRLLAWSTVAHAGYMMVGMYAFTSTGAASVLFYGIVYVAMGFAAFLVVCVLGQSGENPTLKSLAGLHKRSPLLALVLLTAMFGLAGIPPTPGFAGKWFLFSAALERGQFVLVLIAAANATVSLYYYLIVVKAAFLDECDDESKIELPGFTRLAGIATLIAIAFLGILPGPLWDLATGAAEALLGLR